jgi:hypothetical protein
MNKNKIGLTLGYLLAGIHLIWAILIASIPNAVQTFFNWIFKIHGLAPVIQITYMTLANAILLVITTFVIGYILGWLFACVFSHCDCYVKPKRKR